VEKQDNSKILYERPSTNVGRPKYTCLKHLSPKTFGGRPPPRPSSNIHSDLPVSQVHFVGVKFLGGEGMGKRAKNRKGVGDE